MKLSSAAVSMAIKSLIGDPELIGLKDFGTAVGTDSVGQPAIYVWAILSSPTSKKATALENYERIRRKVEDAIERAGLEGYEWIYINLTDEAAFIVDAALDEQLA
jgi:hypothetical protein